MAHTARGAVSLLSRVPGGCRREHQLLPCPRLEELRPVRPAQTVVAASALLLASPAAAQAPAPEPERIEHWEQNGCERGYHWRSAKRGIRANMRHPRARPARARHFARCARTPRAERRASRKVAVWTRWRRSYRGHWTLAEEQIDPAVRARLRVLRGCETRGLGRAGYSYDGHHDGAYQYTSSTWQRAQQWYTAAGRKVVGWTGYAYQASPDHQDAVTALFFPAHESEWACSA